MTEVQNLKNPYHNVILLGAGASFNAGVPLLGSFVDKMWEYAIRGKVRNAAISDSDRAILNEANKIRIGLEKYNSRASFDITNLEDILSLLSFEALSGEAERGTYNTLVKAVARTIELSCQVKYYDGPPRLSNHQIYHQFWHALLGTKNVTNLPALITFNYDLVFERALWEYYHFPENGGYKPNPDSVRLNYFFGELEFSIKKMPHRYAIPRPNLLNEIRDGKKAVFQHIDEPDADIPYLKLHGSLNWSESMGGRLPSNLLTQAVDDPLILPPVFNKMSRGEVSAVWKTALMILREAKHIIIVGYSLPRTDIYMQYFLKSAVGPNSNLQKIIVFDPVFYEDGERSREMCKRYQECFSPQFSNRITFKPETRADDRVNKGNFSKFVQMLSQEPEILFFQP